MGPPNEMRRPFGGGADLGCGGFRSCENIADSGDSSNWIDAEMSAAARRVTTFHLHWMERIGVSRSALARLGVSQAPFGLAPVEVHRDNLFDIVERGPLSVILPVVRPVAFDWAGAEIETMETVDLIAFRTAEPARWSWRNGDGWALGERMLEQNRPVPVVSTPLEWVAAAGEALCILEWDLPVHRWELLRRGPPLVTADARLRQQLNRAFAKSVPALVAEPADYSKREGRHAA